MTALNDARTPTEIQGPESGSVDTERLRSVLAERSIALGRELGRGGSGSYFRSGDGISFQAEITDANRGTLLDAVGPMTSPVDRPDDAIDSLDLGVAAGLRRQLHFEAGSGS